MRYNRVHNISTEQFMNKVSKGKRRKPIPLAQQQEEPIASYTK